MINILSINRLFAALFIFVIAVFLFVTAGCGGTKPKINAADDKKQEYVRLIDSLKQEEALEYYLNGSIHEEAGEIYNALLDYQIAHMYDPTSAGIGISLAKTYTKLGEMPAAIMILEKVIQHNPQDEELIVVLLQHHVVAGNMKRANSLFEDLMAIRPLNQNELKQYGFVLVKQRKVKEAIKIFNEYLDKYGLDPEVLDKLAQLYILRGEAEQAEATIKKLLEVDPDNHFVYYVLGSLALEKQEWQKAEKNFRNAILIDSTDVRYWSNLMFSLSGQHKDSILLIVVQDAIKQFPDVAQFYDIYGNTLQRFDQIEEAIKALKKSIELDSTRISPHLTLGMIYHERDEWDRSAEAYSKALEIDPDHSLVLNNYAYMLACQNYRLEKALEMVNRALAQEPENSSFIDTKGWIFYQMGRYRDALEQIEKAMIIEDDNAELYEHLGFIYKALNKERQAKEAWRKALDLDPDNQKYRDLVENAD